MKPTLSIDISRIPYERLVEALSPFAPGLVLVVGLMLAHPDVAARVFAIRALGYYTKIALVVAAAYVAGWVLFLLVAGGLNYFVVHFWLRSQPPVNTHSRNKEWRSAAQQFVGKELAPTNDEEWADLYLVLQNYFLKSEGGTTHHLLTVLDAIGWAGLVVLCFSPVAYWLAYLVCGLAILVGLSWPWWVAPLPAGPHLTALILRELKKGSG